MRLLSYITPPGVWRILKNQALECFFEQNILNSICSSSAVAAGV